MVSKTSSYHDSLLESLTDPNEARLYLNAVLEDYPDGFLKALRNVAQARQMTRVAKQAGIERESLYRALSNEGNPRWETFTSILTALGLRLQIDTAGELESPAPHPPYLGSILGGISSEAEGVEPEPSHDPSPSNLVDMGQWMSVASSRPKKREQERESTNKPALQEALCR